jgi:DNA/RNA endonuclease G (NUC1)
MKKLVLLVIVFIGMLLPTTAQGIIVKNNVFEALYSEKLEQPLWIKYRNINRPTKVNRGSMDFYKEPNIKTSDADDYKANIYDKGHGAPAASFSDNMENLKQTFSYLN